MDSGNSTQAAELVLQYDKKSRTIYLEFHRGVIASTDELLGGIIVFDLDADGRCLGTEIDLKAATKSLQILL